MTSPIKPPGAPGAGPLPDATKGPNATSGKNFKEVAEKVGADSNQVGVDSKSQTSSAADPAVTGKLVQAELLSLAAQVRSGQISAAQAVDALVKGVIGKYSNAGLGHSQLAEIEKRLRDVVTDDPAFADMMKGLEESGR